MRGKPREADSANGAASDGAAATRLEAFLIASGLKPMRVAREAGVSRQHFLRLRKGIMEPTRATIAQIVSAIRRLTLRRTDASEIFELSIEENGSWSLAQMRESRSPRHKRESTAERTAAARIRAILATPRREWAQRFRATLVTDVLIRELILAGDRILDRNPAAALDVFAEAESLLEERATQFAPDVHAALRGRTFLGRAYGLRQLGRLREALSMLDRAEYEFRRTPYCTHELARAWYERAAELLIMGRLSDAKAFAQQARSVFVLVGDRRRAAQAEMLEGDVLFESGSIEESRNAFREAVALFRRLDDIDSLAAAQLNLGCSEARLGDIDAARRSMEAAKAVFERRGNAGEVVRARWSLARLIAMHEDVDAGLAELRHVRAAFANLGFDLDASFVDLDIVRALFGKRGTGEEIERLCRRILADFDRAGVSANVREALSYLRAAARSRDATAELVDELASFLRRARRDEHLTFKPPAIAPETGTVGAPASAPTASGSKARLRER